MPNPIRFILALHNHQPIGNFEHVLERVYQDSYQPFLDLFERYESLKIALHTSGSLMEWLHEHHSDYVDRLAQLAAAGRIEILGGAFYEPILATIPSRDRIGQIRRYSRWLEERMGTTIRGMWIPERVWEQSFTADLAAAGVEYTLLDDFHFKCAGLSESALHGHYLTEDNGQVISVFPGSERLRYAIPFADPHETVDYLASVAERSPDSIVVFGDDGEKFGAWPETKKHVYTDRWLERFFDCLVENQDWIQVTTLGEALDNVRPLGKTYLPDASYREMTEWVLPADSQNNLTDAIHSMDGDPRWPALQPFVRGGFWRNYRVKYAESNEMYARMMNVSRRLERMTDEAGQSESFDRARLELYRGQCNCGYWHGAFGGIYLPHLRNAIYRHLIAAENLLEAAVDRPQTWVEATAQDFNFDARQEVQLANDKLAALIAPSAGGMLYELDARSICHNLLATITRRPEAYHRKVLGGANSDAEQCASIHDRVVFKQEGLDQRIQYDSYPRKSLIDLFYDADVSLDAVASGKAAQHGDFVDGVYETRLRRSPGRVQAQLSRQGMVGDRPLKLTKAITLSAGSSTLQIVYQLEDLPQDGPLHFAIEFNFAGMPGGADDRYFFDGDRNNLGQLGHRVELLNADRLGLADEWLGLDVGLKMSRPTNFWTFPIETVSQSEGGFELIHQSVVVQPHWSVEPDADGRWAVTIQLWIDTAAAEARAGSRTATATTT